MQNEEVFLTKDSNGKTVGETLSITQSSSSPPAVWTEIYTISKIDDSGVYGMKNRITGFREFTGDDMK